MYKYTESFVLFLDILGFANAVKKSKDPDELISMLKELEELAAGIGKNDLLADLRTIIFSDSIICSIPCDSNSKGELMAGAFILSVAALWQNFLLGHKFLTRGFIAMGPLYHDETTIIGRPYMKAYERERAVGNSPIVVVDSDVIDYADSGDSIPRSPGYRAFFEKLQQDGFGRFSINFLNWGRQDNVPSWNKKDLEGLLRVADDEIAAHSSDFRIVEKWRFLRHYVSAVLKTAYN